MNVDLEWFRRLTSVLAVAAIVAFTLPLACTTGTPEQQPEKPLRVLTHGIPIQVAEEALANAGAKDISWCVSDSIAQLDKGPDYEVIMRTYVLPDATWLQVIYEVNNKDLRIESLVVGEKGKDYGDDKLARSREMTPVKELDLDAHRSPPPGPGESAE